MESEFANPQGPSIDHRIAFGNPKAPVTIVEYLDFECPYCEKARATLVDVIRKYCDSARVIAKPAPLDIHPHARIASLMYEAAARQDPAKAIKLYVALFNNQRTLDAQGAAYLEDAVRAVGADLARVKVDMQSAAVRATITADLDEFKRFGYSGTPSFLINGITLEGAQPASAVERIIDRHLAARTIARKAHAAGPAP